MKTYSFKMIGLACLLTIMLAGCEKETIPNRSDVLPDTSIPSVTTVPSAESSDMAVTSPNASISIEKMDETEAHVSDTGSQKSALLYSTFLGGSDLDITGTMMMDEGAACFAVITRSSDFPVTDDAFDKSFNGGGSEGTEDVVLAIFNTTSNQLEYGSFLGGSKGPDLYGKILLSGDKIFVAGITGSTDFPVTTNAYDSSFNGRATRHAEGYFSQLRGSSLLYSTFIGSDGDDGISDLLIGQNGEIILFSHISNPGEMPVTSKFSDEQRSGNPNGYILCFSPEMDKLLSSSLLGPCSGDLKAVKDDEGYLYIVGSTTSSSFPITEGSFSNVHHGSGDIFLIKLSPMGDKILFSSYLGGSGNELWPSICLDKENNVIVYGKTQSKDFPITENALDQSFDGLSELFISKISSDGKTLLYSSFLGGNEIAGTGFVQEGTGNLVALSNGDLLLCGTTTAPDYPVTSGATYKNASGGEDIFITILDQSLDKIVYSTYFGGSENDFYPAVHMDQAGIITCVCTTQSPDFPVTTGTYDDSFNGNFDVGIFSLSVPVEQ